MSRDNVSAMDNLRAATGAYKCPSPDRLTLSDEDLLLNLATEFGDVYATGMKIAAADCPTIAQAFRGVVDRLRKAEAERDQLKSRPGLVLTKEQIKALDMGIKEYGTGKEYQSACFGITCSDVAAMLATIRAAAAVTP